MHDDHVFHFTIPVRVSPEVLDDLEKGLMTKFSFTSRPPLDFVKRTLSELVAAHVQASMPAITKVIVGGSTRPSKAAGSA